MQAILGIILFIACCVAAIRDAVVKYKRRTAENHAYIVRGQEAYEAANKEP